MVEVLGDRQGLFVDPFAGPGLSLPEFLIPGRQIIGIEIERPWVDRGVSYPDCYVTVGDATDLRKKFPGNPGYIAGAFTSCTYGNRFADKHKAKDDSVRRSYTHDIRKQTGDDDYELADNNTGGMHFDTNGKYESIHRLAWQEAYRYLVPGGPFALNVSDFIRHGTRMAVSAWHIKTLTDIGFEWHNATLVPTPRMRRGQNNKARVDGEWVLTFFKPNS